MNTSKENSFQEKVAQFFVGVLFLLLGGSLTYGLGLLWFPLELAEMQSRWELWQLGMQPVQVSGIHGYIKDQCPEGKKGLNQGCACVALIHGLGDDAKTWKKLLSWPPEKWKSMGLDHSLKIFAIDLPGSGQSASPASMEDYRARNMAGKVKSVLSQYCQDWVVVGNSFGGWVASWIALDFPQLVSRLILVGSAVGTKNHSPSVLRLLENPTVESMQEFQKRAYFRPRSIPDRIWPMIVKKVQTSPLKQIIQAQTQEDQLDLKLPLIRVPTLLLWGKEDRITPLALGYQIRDQVPGVIWREVPECGHLVQKECPLPLIQSIVDMTRFGAM